ncbi:UNKNOWN [Stylonychia lemnae]|uniref:Uncharacterized protein n=1 Tax=Stylonychia lemnae TaxID=5949 RepID=A0A078AD06_STYLE|nr:UNKNOWN [Stylonychia lemnae]|eukprot:CDW79736.1 UNKNOWN [Stylonychia lemnae]
MGSSRLDISSEVEESSAILQSQNFSDFSQLREQNMNVTQFHGAQLTHEQILALSFKEYLFSLDDTQISYRWLNKIDARYSGKQMIPANKEDQQENIIKEKIIQQPIVKISQKNSPQAQRDPNYHEKQEQQRLQSPTLSQLQRLRRQNELLLENDKIQSARFQAVKERLVRQYAQSPKKQQEIQMQINQLSSMTASRGNSNNHSHKSSGQGERSKSQNQRNTISPRDSQVFQRLHEESKMKQQFQQQIQEIKMIHELKDCTFQPTVSSNNTTPLFSIPVAQQPSQQKGNETLMTNISAIEQASLSHSNSNINLISRDDYFTNLSKVGSKLQKAQDLEKIKEILELQECTFKPQINQRQSQSRQRSNSRSDSPNGEVWDRLHKDHQDLQEHKQKQAQEILSQELKECTFSPKIVSRRSLNSISSREEEPQPQPNPYTRLYEKHHEYQQIKKQKEIENKQKELEEFTFQPQRITKSKDNKYPNYAQKPQDHFEKLYQDSKKNQSKILENIPEKEGSSSSVINASRRQQQIQTQIRNRKSMSRKEIMIDTEDSQTLSNRSYRKQGEQETKPNERSLQRIQSSIVIHHPQSAKNSSYHKSIVEKNAHTQDQTNKSKQKIQGLMTNILDYEKQKSRPLPLNTSNQKQFKTMNQVSSTKNATAIKNLLSPTHSVLNIRKPDMFQTARKSIEPKKKISTAERLIIEGQRMQSKKAQIAVLQQHLQSEMSRVQNQNTNRSIYNTDTSRTYNYDRSLYEQSKHNLNHDQDGQMYEL